MWLPFLSSWRYKMLRCFRLRNVLSRAHKDGDTSSARCRDRNTRQVEVRSNGPGQALQWVGWPCSFKEEATTKAISNQVDARLVAEFPPARSLEQRFQGERLGLELLHFCASKVILVAALSSFCRGSSAGGDGKYLLCGVRQR